MFISIRWKLVSTYLLLVVLTLFTFEGLINASLTDYMLTEKNNNLLSQGAILADQIAPSFSAIEKKDRRVYIEQTLKSYSININARVLLVDTNGLVISDAYDDYKGRNLSDLKVVKNALLGSSSSKLYSFDDIGQAIYTCLPINYSGEIIGALLMSSSPQDVHDRIENILGDFYGLSALVILVTLIFSILLTDIFSKPLLELTSVVRDISPGSKVKKIKIHSHDELGVLSESMNLMIARLTAMDDLRKKFVSDVSHELRTPITSLKIIAQTMLDSRPQNVGVYEDFMADIDGELDRLNDIIDTLLNLTNLDQAKVELKISQTNLNTLIEQCIKTLKPIAQKKGIELTYHAKHDVDIELDIIRIRQCIINMVGNAVKYTRSGGAVHVSLTNNRENAIITIEDNGIGIPEEDIPHIFERFYRVDSARSRSTGGSGLGLAIAQQIIILHGGTIKLQSQVNAGSKFILSLPLRRRNES